MKCLLLPLRAELYIPLRESDLLLVISPASHAYSSKFPLANLPASLLGTLNLSSCGLFYTVGLIPPLEWMGTLEHIHCGTRLGAVVEHYCQFITVLTLTPPSETFRIQNKHRHIRKATWSPDTSIRTSNEWASICLPNVLMEGCLTTGMADWLNHKQTC